MAMMLLPETVARSWPESRSVLRWLIAVWLGALAALAGAVAYANPPDPSWIPGLYEDRDSDEIVALVTEATAGVGAIPRDLGRPRVVGAEAVRPLFERARTGCPLSPSPTRGPPAAPSALP